MAKKSNRPHLSLIETRWDKFKKNLFIGTKPELEYSWCLTGRINRKLIYNLTSNINKIISHHDFFKIGKTGDPYIRCDHKDYREGYHHMYLIYKSTSKDIVSKLEEYYIEKYINSHPEKNVNRRINAPGKTMYSYDGYYYLYIVCCN